MPGAVLFALWLALGALFVAVSLAPLIRTPLWWVRCWDFPRAQLAAVGALLAAAGPLFWDRTGPPGPWLTAIMAALTALHVWRVLPFTPLWPRDVARLPVGDPGLAVTILIANVLQENRETGRLLDLIARRDPDIVLLVETDAFWTEAMAPAIARYPHAVVRPQDNHYGLVFLTRLAVRRAEVTSRADPDEPILLADLEFPGGAPLRFWGMHPEPPIPGRSTEDRDADLVCVAREIRADGGTTIVAGDLNDVAWSHTTRLFLRLSGLLDPRRGRGLYASFHADHWLARWPLDHVFVTPDLALAELSIEPSVGSDHFPVFAVLHRAAGATRANAEPREPLPGDRAEAARLAPDNLQPPVAEG